ncbi:MAG: ECF transporter S component [Clostridia bacterium]|nr:ECF transporter S component [Clostridia bacterium]
MKIQTEQIAISGVLSALTLALGATGIGFVPVPTPAGAATLMHLPVILAGILEGPTVGAFVGFLFGLFTFRFLGDFRVVIPARLLIGPAAYIVFAACRRAAWSIPAAAALGSAVNTVGTLALAVTFGYIPLTSTGQTIGAITIAAVQGIPEALAAAVIVTPVVLAVRRVGFGNGPR